MDELEKKRREKSEPLSAINETECSIAESSPKKQQLLKERMILENQINKAFEIKVSPNLAEEIILQQRMNSRKRFSRYIALAASVFTLSIAAIITLNQPELSISEEALAHVYDESSYLESKTLLPKEVVQARLKEMNIQLPALPDKITFAYGCHFGKGKAMHLIAQINGESVTLLVTQDPIQTVQQNFSDTNLIGKIKNVASQGLIAISKNENAIDQLFSSLNITE